MTELEQDEASHKLANVEIELETLLRIFRHTHVNNGIPGDDRCKQCGLDLRHEIHKRIAAQPNADIRHAGPGRAD